MICKCSDGCYVLEFPKIHPLECTPYICHKDLGPFVKKNLMAFVYTMISKTRKMLSKKLHVV